MRLTKNQKRAVEWDANTFVVACPGSGKTRVLVAKLLHCLDEVRDTPRRVACITYTNAAVDEIEVRLRQHGSIGDDTYCDIATIHSFCLNNVVRYFAHRIPGYERGLRVIAPDSDEYRGHVESIADAYGIPDQARENFEHLVRDTDGTPLLPAGSDLIQEAVFDFWERLRNRGFADFPSVIYYTYHLLRTWPSIAHALACRFAWFLLDESQDTSAVQVEILRLISASGKSRFLLVGDPFQSIYAFAGATPQAIHKFAATWGHAPTFPLSITSAPARCLSRWLRSFTLGDRQ